MTALHAMTASYTETDRDYRPDVDPDTSSPTESMSSSRRRDRAAWNEAIQQIDAMNQPTDDEEFECPSEEVIRFARLLAERLRADPEWPAPTRVVTDGVGGVSFEWRSGTESRYLNIYDDGSVEDVQFVGDVQRSRRTLI